MRAGRGRPLTDLTAEESRAYTTAVARVASTIERRLGEQVVANRVFSADPDGPVLRLEPWRSARSRFRAHLLDLVAGARTVVLADVRSCYPSIRTEIVSRSLADLGCEPTAIAEVERVLAIFTRRGVAGLPVGPDASAVLANAVLSSVDRALADRGIAHLRWVDDMVAVPADGAERTVLDLLRDALSGLGLELARAKTRVLANPGGLPRWVPDLVPSGTDTAATLRGDAHPVSGLAGPHARAPEDGGVGPRRRSAHRAGRHG